MRGVVRGEVGKGGYQYDLRSTWYDSGTDKVLLDSSY